MHCPIFQLCPTHHLATQIQSPISHTAACTKHHQYAVAHTDCEDATGTVILKVHNTRQPHHHHQHTRSRTSLVHSIPTRDEQLVDIAQVGSPQLNCTTTAQLKIACTTVCMCIHTSTRQLNRPQHSSAALAACKLHSTLCATATLYTPPLITTEKGTCKHRALYTAYQPTRACSTMRPTDLAMSTGKDKIPMTLLQPSGWGSHRQQHYPSSCLKGIYRQHTCLLA